MGRTLSIRSLTLAQLSQAFPLARAAAPELTLDVWLAYVRTLGGAAHEGSGGVVGALGEDGYIYGLFCYERRCESSVPDRILAVEQLVVLDIVDPAGTLNALLGAIDRIAARANCRRIHLALPARQAAPDFGRMPSTDPFRKAGYIADGLHLCKHIDAAAPPA